ncbi:MAG TPA: glycosyl hydrolase 108 family protein [Dissulfurispiraceae bacterium]|nr:glycosyl hydrolase 108 family protein [Dissulfurispiraceae bacterium]
MREEICRAGAGIASADYTSVRKNPSLSTGNIFSGMLSEQMQTAPGAFDSVVDPILLKRSRYVQGDSPSKFGIHQATLRDYDPRGKVAEQVSQLTPAKARLIYQRIWDRSGAAELPSELQALHFETYIRRPQAARSALRQSGGAADAYAALSSTLLAGGKKMPGQNGLGAQSAAAGATSSASVSRSGDRGFETAVRIIMKHEGKTLVRNDNGMGPSKYGILQSTLQEYDPKGEIAQSVDQLDDAKATQMYAKIWQRSGSGNLPYPLNIIHFDTYLHRPRTALEAMSASGGDPMKYLETRQTSLRGLNSYSKFGVGWERRIEGLARLADASVGSEVRKKV